MSIVETRHYDATADIDDSRRGASEPADFNRRSHSDDAFAANRDRFRPRTRRVAREDFPANEHEVRRLSRRLCVRQGGQCCDAERNAANRDHVRC